MGFEGKFCFTEKLSLAGWAGGEREKFRCSCFAHHIPPPDEPRCSSWFLVSGLKKTWLPEESWGHLFHCHLDAAASKTIGRESGWSHCHSPEGLGTGCCFSHNCVTTLQSPLNPLETEGFMGEIRNVAHTDLGKNMSFLQDFIALVVFHPVNKRI